jgi:hypothetical protein
MEMLKQLVSMSIVVSYEGVGEENINRKVGQMDLAYSRCIYVHINMKDAAKALNSC